MHPPSLRLHRILNGNNAHSTASLHKVAGIVCAGSEMEQDALYKCWSSAERDKPGVAGGIPETCSVLPASKSMNKRAA